MEDVSPIECAVCQENFDEGSRCPRILECFHYLCTDCVHQIIQNKSNKCPFCRRDFQAKCAADVKINTGVLELIKYISKKAFLNQSAQPIESTVADKSVICDFKKESIDATSHLLCDCIEAQQQTECMVLEAKNLREGIQIESSNIETTLMPKIREITSGYTQRMQELAKISNTLENQLKEVKTRHTQLQEAKGKLVASCTLKDAAASVLGAEESRSAIDKWIDTFEEQRDKDEETLFNAREELTVKAEKISAVMDILNATGNKGTQERKISNALASTILSDKTGRMKIEDFQRMDNSVRHLIQKGKIFAVQIHCGKRRAARLTISGGKLLLHHLEDGKRLLNVVKIQHKELMGLVNTEEQLAFLDLAADGLILGRVYIRLHSHTLRAKFFSGLCTGELGYSYVNSKFLEVGFKTTEWEYIRAGDYELNNGEGGMYLLPDQIKDLKEPCQWIAGTVESVFGKGDNVAAQFVIRTRSNPNNVCPLAYGIVVEGLDVIRTAIRCYEDIGIVRIKDCGIVLSTSLG